MKTTDNRMVFAIATFIIRFDALKSASEQATFATESSDHFPFCVLEKRTTGKKKSQMKLANLLRGATSNHAAGGDGATRSPAQPPVDPATPAQPHTAVEVGSQSPQAQQQLLLQLPSVLNAAVNAAHGFAAPTNVAGLTAAALLNNTVQRSFAPNLLAPLGGGNATAPGGDGAGEYAGGAFARTDRLATKAAAENRRLAALLQDGRRFVGEHHAQLALDHVFLEDQVAKAQAALEAATAEEDQLEARLTFLFEGCARLSRENSELVAEGQRRDAELEQMRLQVKLQCGKHDSQQRAARQHQREQEEAGRAAARGLDGYHAARRKLLEQHQHRWMLTDETEFFRDEAKRLAALIDTLQGREARSGVPGGSDASECDARSEAGRSSSLRRGNQPSAVGRPSIAAGNESPSMPRGREAIDAWSMLGFESGAGATAKAGGAMCERADCRMFHGLLKALNTEIQQCAKQKRTAGGKEASSNVPLLEASVQQKRPSAVMSLLPKAAQTAPARPSRT